MKIAIMRHVQGSVVLVASLFLLSACGVSLQTAGDVAQGRQALFRGDNQTALAYFQGAAKTDPNYLYGDVLQEGVYSFLGRAQYLNGQYAPARQSLEKDLAQRPGASLSRLYLGLTLARLDDRQSGLKDIEAGTKGIGDFINNITGYASPDIAQYWDPGRAIRNSVNTNIKMIAAGNFDWPTLITNSESLASAFEQEPDRANEQREREREMAR
jgi:tetratricopeptide (TPR) repeat protein